jgi:hypothetical protein
MSEFKHIKDKIQDLLAFDNDNSLSEYGKDFLTELQRIKKEHSEMLEMLNKVVSEFSHYKEKAQGTSKCGAIIEAEELITQITQP